MLRQEKGITLMALIITIIVLVILAAISISAAYNSGIIGHGVNAAYDYANAAQLENEIMASTESYMNSVVSEIKSLMASKGGAGA